MLISRGTMAMAAIDVVFTAGFSRVSFRLEKWSQAAVSVVERESFQENPHISGLDL
jgi:hypothetical protein